MLKKLAKYGNSTTLVIDKAILELLNMDETSIVKLQTDGKSLVITPVEADNQEKKVSYTPQEALMTVNSQRKALYQKYLEHPTAIDPKMQLEFFHVFQKHQPAMNRFSCFTLTEEFQNSLAENTQGIDPVAQSDVYLKEYRKLKSKFFPELDEMDKEIEAIGKKYQVPSQEPTLLS